MLASAIPAHTEITEKAGANASVTLINVRDAKSFAKEMERLLLAGRATSNNFNLPSWTEFVAGARNVYSRVCMSSSASEEHASMPRFSASGRDSKESDYLMVKHAIAASRPADFVQREPNRSSLPDESKDSGQGAARISLRGVGRCPPFPRREEGGCVLSATIDRFAYGSLDPRNDRRVTIESVDFKTSADMSLDQEIQCDGHLDLIKAAVIKFGRENTAGYDLVCVPARHQGPGSEHLPQ